jgi:hypothetical protein
MLALFGGIICLLVAIFNLQRYVMFIPDCVAGRNEMLVSFFSNKIIRFLSPRFSAKRVSQLPSL